MNDTTNNLPASSGAALMEKIVSLCKRRGFIYPSSEIYGGINGFWDYGPLGSELKRNVKELWWRDMVLERDDVVGLEATIIMHPKIWKASGHVDTFADMMRECPLTKKRVRADQVEPQSGVIYRWSGAESHASPFKCEKPFAVLLRKGEHPDTARKKAREYYAHGTIDAETGRWKDLELTGETTATAADSVDFHPESGAQLTEARPFNLMFKTFVGASEPAEEAYLRPETAQAIFTQFKNVLETSRQRTPFGIAQIGKAFRNEVTPRNYTFRSREFEQMEVEFFIKPDEVVEAISGKVARASEISNPPSAIANPRSDWGWEAWHKYWVEERIAFYEGIGLPRHSLVEYWQKAEELAHYARATVDILYRFPFSKRNDGGELMGEELEGIAARSDFDLSQHERHSGKPMGVFDEDLRAAWTALPKEKQDALWKRYYENRKKYLVKAGATGDEAHKEATEDANGLPKGQYIPHVIEPSAGVDRLILALICNAYSEVTETDEKGRSETRVILKFHPRVAPIKAGVMPLLKNKPALVKKAMEIRDLLRPWINVFYDDGGSIGRRYARQDEAGTPFCVTVDFETLGEKPELLDTVTVRHRDDGRQERVKISELLNWLMPRVR
ncbi:MAG: glycine--tRNA ligase [Verrucomicrobia bacterium]|nr:glycine--tRNA ligase [Verrucomicrobiota bacterium]MDE3098985.1 glycine--tRNA ligase [Verrucomicrobiota bacterium]